MRLITLGSLIFLYGCSPTPADELTSTVNAVIKLSRNSRMFFFDDQTNFSMQKYFSKKINDAWTRAFRKHIDETLMDGDFISGYQGVTSIIVASIKTELMSGATGYVAAQLLVLTEGERKTVNARFRLKYEVSSWKIDDISNQSVPSLLRSLEME